MNKTCLRTHDQTLELKNFIINKFVSKIKEMNKINVVNI